VSIVEGPGSQTGLDRWGEHSAMRIDPADDCTFWHCNQYQVLSGTFNRSSYPGERTCLSFLRLGFFGKFSASV
jgi:hypothetical protein